MAEAAKTEVRQLNRSEKQTQNQDIAYLNSLETMVDSQYPEEMEQALEQEEPNATLTEDQLESILTKHVRSFEKAIQTAASGLQAYQNIVLSQQQTMQQQANMIDSQNKLINDQQQNFVQQAGVIENQTQSIERQTQALNEMRNEMSRSIEQVRQEIQEQTKQNENKKVKRFTKFKLAFKNIYNGTLERTSNMLKNAAKSLDNKVSPSQNQAANKEQQAAQSKNNTQQQPNVKIKEKLTPPPWRTPGSPMIKPNPPVNTRTGSKTQNTAAVAGSSNNQNVEAMKKIVTEQQTFLKNENKGQVVEAVKENTVDKELSRDDLEQALNKMYTKIQSYIDEQIAEVYKGPTTEENQSQSTVKNGQEPEGDSFPARSSVHKNFSTKVANDVAALVEDIKQLPQNVIVNKTLVKDVEKETAAIVEENLERIDNKVKENFAALSPEEKQIEFEKFVDSLPETHPELVSVTENENGKDLNLSNLEVYSYQGTNELEKTEYQSNSVEWTGYQEIPIEQGANDIDSSLNLLKVAEKYKILDDPAFDTNELEQLFSKHTTDYDIYRAIQSHRNEKMIDWAYENVVSPEFVDNYKAMLNENLNNHIDDGHSFYQGSTENTYVVVPNEKSFDLVTYNSGVVQGEVSFDSIEELKKGLQSRGATPVTNNAIHPPKMKQAALEIERDYQKQQEKETTNENTTKKSRSNERSL